MSHDDELYHHGILGQKWGKRNGPPYPLGEEDHSKSEKEAGWRKSINSTASSVKDRASGVKKRGLDKLSSSYQKEYGFDKQTSDEEARKTWKTVRNVAIGAGVAIGVSAAVYLTVKHGREVADGVIKAGTTLQTVSFDAKRLEKGEAFYTAFKDADKTKYVGMFGRDMWHGQNKFVINAIVDNDVKIAGGGSAAKIFNQGILNLPGMKEHLKEWRSYLEEFHGENSSHLTNYEVFNRVALLSHDDYTESSVRKFFGLLKENGYGALADINDRKYSGFNTDAVVFFDKEALLKAGTGDAFYKTVRELEDTEISNSAAKAIIDQAKNAVVSPKFVGYGSAMIGAGVLKRRSSQLKKIARREAG